jgi:hypothetical protein
MEIEWQRAEKNKQPLLSIVKDASDGKLIQ